MMDITQETQKKQVAIPRFTEKDFEVPVFTENDFKPQNLGGVKPYDPGLVDDNDTSRAGFWTNLGKKFSATIYDLGKGITEMPQWQEATQNTYVKGLTNAYLNRQVKKGNIDRAAADEFMGRYEDVVPKMGFMYPVQPGKETLGEKIAESGANKWLGGTAEQLRKEANRYDKGVTEYLKNKEYGKALGAEITGVIESMPYTIAAAFGGAMGAAGLGAVVGSQTYDQVKDREDMSDAMKLIDATSTAFWESFFEYVGTKQVADILKKRYATVAKDKVEDGIKKGITGFLEKAYKKFGVWFAPVHEGTSEFATQVAQNLTAKYTGEDPNRNPWDGAVDSFLVGMGMGTMSAAVEQGMEQIPKYYQRKIQGGQSNIAPPDPDQGVKDIINVYGERLKFNSNVPLAEDQNPLMSIASHKIEDKKFFLTGESGKLGDHVFTGYDYDALKEVGYDFTQVTPRLIKASDIRERMDIPYNEWLQSEVDLYKQTQVQGQQLMTKANAPVQEGQEITLGDKTFNVTFIDENGITLNEIDKQGNLTEGELIVPPEDYEKVFGVPAVDSGQISPNSGQISPENVTEQGLQPQNNVTEQGQSTSVDNALIPQLPVNKKGEIEYDQITEPDMYAQGLTQEFGEDAPAILEDLIAEQETALEKAKKTGNAIEKARKIKAISAELKKLEGAKEILTPTATATQGNLDARSASPVQEEPGNIVESIFGKVEDRQLKKGGTVKTKLQTSISDDGEVRTTKAKSVLVRDGKDISASTQVNYIDVDEFNKRIEPLIEKNPDLGYGSTDAWVEWVDDLSKDAEKVSFIELREGVGANKNKKRFIEVRVRWKDGYESKYLFELKQADTTTDQNTGKDSPEAQLIKANAQVDTRPTEAQKEAGNYQKGHLKVQGLDITIENPVGSIRKGTDKKGNDWAIMLNNSYGYIRRTVSPEGNDQIDVFLGDNLDSDSVYVIDQIDPETGKFDEPKVMLGFRSLQDAKDNYLANYEPGWKGLGDISKMSMDAFKEWVFDKEATQKPLAYKEDVEEEQNPSIENFTKADATIISRLENTIPVDFKSHIDDFRNTGKMIRYKEGGVEIVIYDDSISKFPTSYTQRPSVIYINLDHLSDAPTVFLNGKPSEYIDAYYALLHELSHTKDLEDVIMPEQGWNEYINSPQEKRAMDAGDKWLKMGLTEQPGTKGTEGGAGEETKYQYVNISDKAFVVKGDTKPIKDKLKELGGRWHPKQVAWMFPLTKLDEVKSALEGTAPVQETKTKDDIDKLNDLFAERPEKPPVEQPQGGQYKYKMSARPFDIGTYPKEGFVKAEDDPKGGFQILTYDRKLSEKERSHWSFLPLTEVDELKDKQFEDPDGEYFVDLEWMPNYSGADVSMFDSKNQLVEKPYFMSTNEILKNIESGYWKEKKETEKPNESPKSKTEFTFMSDNPMGQGKTLAALSKPTKYKDRIMKIYEFVESLEPGLKIETAKIYSSKSEKGYTDKLVIGDHIVFYKAEQDYYAYLQNGGMSYSEHLKKEAETKKIQDQKDAERREKEREEMAKSQLEQQKKAMALRDAIYTEILSGEINRDRFIQENTQATANVIKQLEGVKQTTEVKRQLMVDRSNLESRIKSLGEQYDLVKRLYKLDNGKVVKKYDYQIGDDVIVNAWNKSTQTKIESLRENPDGSVTYIVEKHDDIPNQYLGYESLEPGKPSKTEEAVRQEEQSSLSPIQQKQIAKINSAMGVKYATDEKPELKFLEDVLPSKKPDKKDKIRVDDVSGEFRIKPIIQNIKTKTEDDALKNAVAIDPLRPIMEGIYYDADNQVKIASDAKIMVVIPTKITGKSRIINPKTKHTLECIYPNYKSVIPQNVFVAKVNALDILNMVSGIDRANAFVESWGDEVAITAKINYDDKSIEFNPAMLKRAITALLESGTIDIRFEFPPSPSSALVIRDMNNSNKFALVMPVMAGNRTSTILNTKTNIDPDIIKEGLKKLQEENWAEKYHAKELSEAKDKFSIEYHTKGLEEAKNERLSQIKELEARLADITNEKTIETPIVANNTEGRTAETVETKPIDKESLPKLEDFGEKIGGARKDMNITRTARDTDSMPAWRRKYHYANADGTINLGAPIDTSKPFIVQWSKEIATWNGKRAVYRDVTTIDTREIKVFNSEEEAEAYIPIYEVWKQNFRIRKSGENYVITKTSSTGKAVEYGTFPTEEDATTYMYSTEGATSLLNHKREDFSIPALDKVERTGTDWRKGKDVSTEEFMSTFGFRGGEFGNWVKPEERRVMLNAAYDSFMDLAEILNVPPTALSFGGELSIAFGARGVKGAAAHFEPGRAVINLTRMNGAGSLAHEWAHAMDNYFGIQGAKKDYARDEKGEVKAGNVMRTTSGLLSIQGMRKELSEKFDKIVEATQSKSVTRVMGIEEKQKAYDKQKAAAQREGEALLKKFENGVRRYKYNRQTKRQEEIIVKATPDQVKKAKAIVDKILEGKGTRPKWDRIPESKSRFGDYSYISPETLALNELYREVFGHNGLKRDGNGFYNLGYFADKMYHAKGILDKALAGESETLNVATDFLKVSKEFDKTRANPYWGTKVEMFARAFEYFVQTKLDEKNVRADYLMYDKAPVYDAVYGKNPYPSAEERAEVNRLFQEFFDEVKVRTDENNVSLLYETEDQYKKDQLDGYDSEAERQMAVEETVSQTEGRVLTSGLRSTGSLLQKILPRTVLKGFKESGYVNVIGQKVESPQDIADLWAIHRSPYIEKAHLIFVRDGKIVATTASTINRIGSSMFMKPQDVLRLYNKYKADGVYYLHNHPSGNHQTSLQDIITTNAHYMALERGGANLLGALVIDHNKFSYIDIKNNPIEDGDFYSSEEVEDYRKNRVQELEYKNPVSKLFHERESIQEGGQERMFEIARALLTENNYKGALVYVSSNLEISAYDVFPEGASAKDIIRLAKEGLKSNLGRSVVFIHDGSYGNELSINGQLPYDTLDVINTAKNESQWFSKEPRKGYANVVADKLWDEESEYKKSEFAGEYLEGKQDITQTPAFKKWFGNSKVVDENGKPLVVYHGSEDEKYIFEPFSHFGTEAAARERIKSITDKRGFIHPVYLSAANIIRVSDTGTNSPIDIAHEIGGIDLAIKSFRVYLENIPESELENVSLRAGFTDTATVDELVEEAIDRYNRLNKKSGDILDLLGDYREYIIKDAQDKAFLVASSYAKENGIDGIVYENEIEDPGSDSYIVFSPTQVKSATGNKGTFDPENPSILEEQQAPYQFAGDWLAKKPDPGPNPELLKSAAQVYKEKEAKRTIPETIQGIREYIQDMNLPIRKFEEEVLKRGGKQDNNSKPYRDTSLSFGRQEKLYTDFFEQKMKPILRSISKMKKAGIPGEEVLPYVISKHAIERNAVMRGKELREWVDSNQDATPDEIDAKREELKDKDYSGVMAFDTKKQYKNPDELAWDIVREFESRVDKSLIDELWSNVKTATQATLETWEAGNQLSPDQKKEYQEQYRYFVPLRGWRDDAAKELVYTRGEGFSNSLKKAEGRKSLADNPLAYILSVQFQAIAEQVDNEVKISMYNLIARNLNNPEINELATIKKLYNVKVKLPDGTEAWMETDARPAPELFASGDAKTKIYREHERLRKPRNAREHEVIVRKPGGDMIIVFKKKHLTTAQALNKQNYMFRAIWGGIYDARDMNKVMSMMGYFNNMLKALYTSWNVVFPFTNFMRDFQEASITQSIKQGTGLKVMINYRGAFPAVFRNLIGKPNLNNQLDRDLQDFYTLGGATGYTHTKTIEEIEKEVDREVDRLVREGTLTGSMKNGFRTTMRAIETWNKVFEDATRFSVYLSSIAAGNSKQDAAIDAKEASVNFNRKGKGSKAWDSWFAFFNVAMQSLQKNFKLAKDHGGKFSAIAGSFIMMGFLEALMNAMTDDDEPDSSYYNINPYMRQNYLIIPNLPRLLTTGEKGNKYLSIPLPQFWRGFKSIGAIAFDIATRKMTVKDGIMDALGNFASGLLPVDVGGFWKSGEFSFAPIAPTIFKPGVEVLENRNYMGYTIKNEPFTRELKKSLANAGLGKNNVSPAAKYLTDMLFRWGGGKGKYKYYYDQEKGESHKVPGLLDINPSSIEHLFKGYTGGTGTGFSDLITTVVQATSPDQDIDFRNVPFLNRFIRKIPEDKWNIIGEYYDLRDDAKINSDLQKEAVKEAERTGDWSEVTAMYGNEYLQRYHETFRYYESELDDAMKMKDFDLVEGNRLSVEIMERAIQDIQRLKQEYGKK